MNDFVAHILVVDDDEGIRSLIKQYLNENNFLVTTSDSAENAEEKISIIKFDLIVFGCNDDRQKWVRFYQSKINLRLIPL
jgi:DNA-binding response OmpR family regulator